MSLDTEALVKRARQLCGCWNCTAGRDQCVFVPVIFARLCAEEDRRESPLPAGALGRSAAQPQEPGR